MLRRHRLPDVHYVATDYPTYTLMTTSSLSSAYAYAAGLCRTAPGYTINATATCTTDLTYQDCSDLR